MEVVIILIACALILWIDYLIAKEFYFVAQAKGYYEKKYLWICFLLGAVGYLLVIALPNQPNAQRETNDDLPAL